MRIFGKILVVCVAILMLTACGEVAGDPSETVEKYITAKASADADTIAELLCSEKEADLNRESMSFASVEARIEGMSCSRVGETNSVSCEGAIVATYGTEDESFELGTYDVVLEDGEWRWCGESQ